jgi:hypothetical protein
VEDLREKYHSTNNALTAAREGEKISQITHNGLKQQLEEAFELIAENNRTITANQQVLTRLHLTKGNLVELLQLFCHYSINLSFPHVCVCCSNIPTGDILP